MQASRLYLLAIVMSLTSWAWVVSNSFVGTSQMPNLCIIKRATGFACPACGTTRAVVQLTKGHFLEGVRTNPLGIVALLLMIGVPIWLIRDYLLGKMDFVKMYFAIEQGIKSKPWLYSSLAALLLLNWYWNIQKGL